MDSVIFPVVFTEPRPSMQRKRRTDVLCSHMKGQPSDGTNAAENARTRRDFPENNCFRRYSAAENASKHNNITTISLEIKPDRKFFEVMKKKQ